MSDDNKSDSSQSEFDEEQDELNAAKMVNWKPYKFRSYETMGLASTEINPTMRPCGFKKDGNYRKIKDSCLLARMRNLCILGDRRPKLAVCITMYNEAVDEFKTTI